MAKRPILTGDYGQLFTCQLCMACIGTLSLKGKFAVVSGSKILSSWDFLLLKGSFDFYAHSTLVRVCI